MSRFAISVAVCLGLLSASTASAEPVATTEDRTNHTFALEGSLGLFTPVGWGGVNVEWLPHPRVILGAGAGLGFSGPQLSVMPRVIVIKSNQGYMSLGAGYSVGEWEEFNVPISGADNVIREWARGHWANTEVSFSFFPSKGFRIRLISGVGFFLNPDPDDCYISYEGGIFECSEEDWEPNTTSLPYFGVAFAMTR